MDTEIPDLNLFMICRNLRVSACSDLPKGYFFRLCRKNELETWKAMHIDDPEEYDAYDAVLSAYIDKIYAPEGNAFFEKCVFICTAEDEPIGTCFIWKAYNSFPAVHWLKVLPQHEGKGLGRAVLSYVLKSLPAEEYPVFLHTHPSSFRAVKLYSDLGFELLTDDVIGFRRNDIAECMPYLKAHMPDKDYRNLKMTSAPSYFLEAVRSSAAEEF